VHCILHSIKELLCSRVHLSRKAQGELRTSLMTPKNNSMFSPVPESGEGELGVSHDVITPGKKLKNSVN